GLLLIDVRSLVVLVIVVSASTLAMLISAALTLNWVRVRLKAWEFALLAVAVALRFRPDASMDRIEPEYRAVPPAQLVQGVKDTETLDRLVLVIAGTTIEGDAVTKTVALQLPGRQGDDAVKRLADGGLRVTMLGQQVQIGSVKFG